MYDKIEFNSLREKEISRFYYEIDKISLTIGLSIRGDIACMDKDGVFFYKQRLKHMIISSGYNVYSSQIEEVIEQHPAVLSCSVVGVPHKYKIEVAKAFIVLKEGYSASLELKQDIKELCKKNLAVYSVPKEYEFRKSLPKTLLGKIDINKLKEDSNNKS